MHDFHDFICKKILQMVKTDIITKIISLRIMHNMQIL